jgi:hypothetical protein
MMTTLSGKTGAWGFVPYGRAQFGSKASAIEPRFETSIPNDGQHNVPVTQALKFTTYCFSSFLDISNTRVFISEDGGATFALAFDGTFFLAPYTGRMRRADGQRLVCYLQKLGNWPPNKKIVVRFGGADEFGHEASKVFPRKWAT